MNEHKSRTALLKLIPTLAFLLYTLGGMPCREERLSAVGYPIAVSVRSECKAVSGRHIRQETAENLELLLHVAQAIMQSRLLCGSHSLAEFTTIDFLYV